MDLDPKIEEVCLQLLGLISVITSLQAARKASYRALGLGEDAIAKHMAEYPNVPGIVVGDEARLRQVVSNLATSVFFFLLAMFFFAHVPK